MKKQTSLPRWVGFFALATLVFAVSGYQARAAGAAAAAEKRADVITIDAMASDGTLELPAVTFLHDQHTKALSAVQKDCSSCHKPLAGQATEKDGYYNFTFMDTASLSGDALKEHYHAKCIGCHADMGKGPQAAECRSCHTPRPVQQSDRQDMGFDKVMHYKHVASSQIRTPGEDTNCASCHHVYDAQAQRLVWGKNKEDSCRACHKLPDEAAALLQKDSAAADENGPLSKRPTLDAAAHQSCVNCHMKVAALDQPEIKTGPTDCAGCHSPAAVAAFAEANAKIMDTIPRLERGQSDAVLMLPAPQKTEKLVSSMQPVSFNHKFHESVTPDCRSCHHKKISSCADCHSLEGKPEGNFVNQARAMHSAQAKQSCVGCHNTQKQDPSCAGCHYVTPKHISADSCQSCHSTPDGVSVQNAENASLLTLGKEERTALAAGTVAGRERRQVTTFSQEDIPETVSIGVLSNEYMPSELPHRKIVNTLLEKQKNNRLAVAFHQNDATVCMGCHHNSPASKTPPKCVSCHSVDVKSGTDGMLSLKAAYHQQCMTCHARMNQKPLETDCAGCHKPRGN